MNNSTFLLFGYSDQLTGGRELFREETAHSAGPVVYHYLFNEIYGGGPDWPLDNNIEQIAQVWTHSNIPSSIRACLLMTAPNARISRAHYRRAARDCRTFNRLIVQTIKSHVPNAWPQIAAVFDDPTRGGNEMPEHIRFLHGWSLTKRLRAAFGDESFEVYERLDSVAKKKPPIDAEQLMRDTNDLTYRFAELLAPDEFNRDTKHYDEQSLVGTQSWMLACIAYEQLLNIDVLKEMEEL